MSDRPRPSLTPAQTAYLAGIVDGEGYIGLCKTSERRYLLRVVITTTCKDLVTWIEGTIGLGSTRFRDMSHRQRQNVYEWKVFGAEAGSLLELISPYMIIKRAQATIATRYQENTALSGEARTAFAKQCHESIKLLNSKQAWQQNLGAS